MSKINYAGQIIGGICTIGGPALSYSAPLVHDMPTALTMIAAGFVSTCYGIYTWARSKGANEEERLAKDVSQTFQQLGKILTPEGEHMLNINIAETDTRIIRRRIKEVKDKPELLEEKLGALIR